jgi:hypothetical protein
MHIIKNLISRQEIKLNAQNNDKVCRTPVDVVEYAQNRCPRGYVRTTPPSNHSYFNDCVLD